LKCSAFLQTLHNNKKYLNKKIKIILFKARRRGLVVRVKTHVQKVVSSNPGPAVETIYHAPLIWIKSMKAKIVEKVTWHCCVCCNPAKGEGGV
jgi:hypothetical protein